ncbi:MFS transporter [Pseudonocardia sp. WMMC193]|uniref:MFS transporter n=1 Tax=Pseudonocardia sp. WMMC193 TaxID=2911965 RepID=UPI001F016E14|nr:MFS transporter [Pseudonocardia sp. WMMC193]MCF7552721.1 MFS transporter [Pseudonocardia sp. WMMC193]
MRALLANRVYRRLFAAQVIALVGTGLATVALGLLAYDLAGERAGEVLGTALAIKMVAYVCVSPLVGAIADRVPRRFLMVGADLIRVVVVALLPLVGSVWQVYLLIAVLQAASAAFTPVFQSTLPDVLPDERDFTAALSASQVAVSLENILSPLLAAALLFVIDFSTLFVGTAFGFVASAVLVHGASVPAATRSARDRFVDRLSSGVKIMARTPRLRTVLALNMVIAGTGAVTLVSTVNVVRVLLGGGENQVPLLLAASGTGTALAALGAPILLRHWTERRVMLSGAVLAVLAVSGAVVLSLAPSWALAAAVWVTIGAGTGTILVPIGRVIRASSTPQDRPALFAAQFSLSHGCWLITYPLTGWVGTLAGFTVAWSASAVIVVTAAVSARLLCASGTTTVVRHSHDDSAGHDHLAGAESSEGTWVHTHHVVIDDNHRRWPSAVG